MWGVTGLVNPVNPITIPEVKPERQELVEAVVAAVNWVVEKRFGRPLMPRRNGLGATSERKEKMTQKILPKILVIETKIERSEKQSNNKTQDLCRNCGNPIEG